MRRFFVEKIENREGSCLIEGREARHILKVLRLGPGDDFILMDGQGDQYRVRIKSAGRHDLRVSLEEQLDPWSPAPIRITIGQAVLKSKAMDLLIQKCSELGVARIIPFFSERTVFGPGRDRFENKMRHWLEISRNAAKQSGRPKPAEIARPMDFEAFLDGPGRGEAFKIVLWEGEKTRDLKGVIRSVTPVKEVVGVIGPEGGFADREIASAREAGFAPVSLGRRILRAETAGMTLVALLQYEWGDLGIE